MKKLLLFALLLLVSTVNPAAEAIYESGKLHARLAAHVQEAELSTHSVFVHAVASYKKPFASKSDDRLPYAAKLSRWMTLTLHQGIEESTTMLQLRKTGLFDVVEPVPVVKPCFVPNDPAVTSQYALSRLQLFSAWDVFQGDTNVVIGITDTGCELNHSDLQGSIKYNYNDPPDGIDNDGDGYTDNFSGWDCANNDNNPSPDPCATCNHGVHVAGIAGATANNAIGIAGTGFKCKLLPIKIADNTGSLTASWEGVVYAADHGCKIINCSWGGPGGGQFGQDVVEYATYQRHALVVAAAGNSASSTDFFPASYKPVMSVAATDETDTRWSLSNYGPNVDVCAPGSNIYSTWINSGYTSSSGTSMAAPAVAGCAGIVAAYFPTEEPWQWAARIKNSCDYIDTISGNQAVAGFLGNGRVNLYRALTEQPSPAIRVVAENFSDGNDQAFVSADTISLRSFFLNDLQPAAGLTIRLRSLSPYVTLIDSVFGAGSLQPGDTINNNSFPFRFSVSASAPINQDVMLKYIFSDSSGYNAHAYTSVTVNVNYLNLTENNLWTSITGQGLFGYNSPSQTQGLGVTLNGSASLLYEGGLLVGDTFGNVSDRIRSSAGNSDTDWMVTQPVYRLSNPTEADCEISSRFNDAGAGTTSLGIEVHQEALAWGDVANADYIMLRFTLTNNSGNNFPALYAGLFADWDIGNFAQNMASLDASRNLGYAYSTQAGGMYAGIKLLSGQSFVYYAIDLSGTGAGGVNLSDGFSGTEKSMVLITGRNAAGTLPSGNDIAHVVSAGPFSLMAGDSITVAFALMAGNNLQQLLQTADAAQQQYNGTLTSNTTRDVASLRLFPNPAQDMIQLSETGGYYTIADISGVPLLSGNNKGSIDTQSLVPGVYTISLKTNNKRQLARFVKIR